jgi:hypothetical protein
MVYSTPVLSAEVFDLVQIRNCAGIASDHQMEVRGVPWGPYGTVLDPHPHPKGLAIARWHRYIWDA